MVNSPVIATSRKLTTTMTFRNRKMKTSIQCRGRTNGRTPMAASSTATPTIVPGATLEFLTGAEDAGRPHDEHDHHEEKPEDRGQHTVREGRHEGVEKAIRHGGDQGPLEAPHPAHDHHDDGGDEHIVPHVGIDH